VGRESSREASTVGLNLRREASRELSREVRRY